MTDLLDPTELSAPTPLIESVSMPANSFKSPPIPPKEIGLSVRTEGDEIILRAAGREYWMTIASAVRLTNDLAAAISAWGESYGPRQDT